MPVRSVSKKGFTLIELLVVMAILGILATVGIASFRSSQLKSRDAKRKSNLKEVQQALEMYNNDHGLYPLSSLATGGKIKIGETSIDWGEEMVDDNDTVYMTELPQDPTGNPDYCYLSADGRSYQLYAKLENSQDSGCLNEDCSADRTCGSYLYNYGVSSPNTTP